MAEAAWVSVDLNNARFLDEFTALDATQVKLLIKTIKKVRAMNWAQIQIDKGLHFEKIIGSDDLYSIRLNQQARAVVMRRGGDMVFLSLHFDHDSAYAK